MRIGIVGGTGREGTGLGARWGAAGHAVKLGSRDRVRAAEVAAALGLEGGTNAEAVTFGDVVVLAVPFAAHGGVLREVAPLVGSRVVVDITVPLVPPQVRRVHLPPGGSAAAQARATLGPDARIVSTLHHVSSAHLADPHHAIDCDVLACSDHADALDLVLGLLGDLGLRGIDAGPLANAVALEALTPVLLHVNKRYKAQGAGLRITGV